jgi:NAD(P)-dependent dehydrogenase (short-subunit alcohol dehydrogenase family)
MSMRASFAGRVALVTGAGSGLGRELARVLAEEGAAVAAIDLHGGPLQQLADELAAKSFAWAVADVTDRSGLREATAELEGRIGAVDLLVANAGIGCETSALDFDAEAVAEIVRVNLLGAVNSIEAVLPGMLRRRHGQLVGISSLASYRGLPLMAGYCASKAGLNALLEGLRVELKPHGITVTTVCPGWMRTPMTAAVKIPMTGLMEAEHAARQILDAVNQQQPFFAFPRPLRRKMRLLSWLPASLSDWIVEQSWRKICRQRAVGSRQ